MGADEDIHATADREALQMKLGRVRGIPPIRDPTPRTKTCLGDPGMRLRMEAVPLVHGRRNKGGLGFVVSLVPKCERPGGIRWSLTGVNYLRFNPGDNSLTYA